MAGFDSILPQIAARVPETLAEFGSRGEALAAEHLVENGYRLIAANFTIPVGRNSKGVQITGEIDLIAMDGDTLCFIEVKTRRSAEFTPVITAVDLRKQRQISRTARIYRRIFRVSGVDHRYDVVTVVMPADEKPHVELVKGYWNDSVFRKRRWHDPIWNDFV